MFGRGTTGVYGGGTTEPPSVLSGQNVVYAGLMDIVVLVGHFVAYVGYGVIVIPVIV